MSAQLKADARVYLTPAKKSHILAQMEVAREVPEDDVDFGGWRMDETLEDDFARLNRFDCLQTMTSRFPRFLPQMEFGYLQVAFTEAVEERLTAFLKELEKVIPEFWVDPTRIHAGEAEERYGRLRDMVAEATNVPEPYQELEMLMDPVKYNQIESVLIQFGPTQEFVDSLVNEDSYTMYQALWPRYERLWSTLISGLEAIAQELQPAAACA